MAKEPTDKAAGSIEVARAVEALARDLLALVRGVRVYPDSHPFLADLAGRMVASVRERLPDPLTIGVAARELAVGTAFVGGKRVRAAELAALLHSRKVLRLVWNRDATEADVTGLADLLADKALQGESLQTALRQRGIYALDIEPLTLERIHDSFREGARGGDGDNADRGRQAWQWLLSDHTPPARIAELLASDAFWDEAGPDRPDPARMTELLARMGERLGAALDCLPGDRREHVESRLATVGREISPRDLARVLQAADAAGVLDGPMGDALEETFGGDRLVDLLASLVALEGRNTQRLASVYGRFSRARVDDLLPAVRARLASDGGGFTVEVWKAVEDFLLELQEDPYMGADYSSSLEKFAAAATDEAPAGADFSIDLEPLTDRMLAGLALHDPEAWRGPLLDRLEARADEADPTDLLDLLTEIDDAAPGLLDTRPAVVEKLFRRLAGAVRTLGEDLRRGVREWARVHERTVVEPVLRLLSEADSLTVRRFLVDVVAGFSPASTPTIVSRMRSAPWYVTRNLAIALGRRRERLAIPTFLSLLGHDNPKVRREVILALGQFDDPEPREALVAFASGRGVHSPEERTLARRALQLAQNRQALP